MLVPQVTFTAWLPTAAVGEMQVMTDEDVAVGIVHAVPPIKTVQPVANPDPLIVRVAPPDVLRTLDAEALVTVRLEPEYTAHIT